MSVAEYLQLQQEQFPEYNDYWKAFEGYYNKKLWHQLTKKIESFVKLKLNEKLDLLTFYHRFISDFESKLNLLSLVQIISFIIKHISDYQECLSFLNKIKEKVRTDHYATLLCSILISQLKLAHRDLDGVKAILNEISPLIDQETGVTPIHGPYFQLSSDYHQLIGNYAAYYRNALRFLGCTNLETEPVEELERRAFALALAALLGDSIFNFGELLQHPIVNHLKGWVLELLYAFNSGNFEKFNALRPHWSAQPDLAAHEVQLRTKISLLCLMEMTFNSPNGILTFAEVAQKTDLQENSIEFLVINALSLGLVKGTIDEVEKKIYLNWVQPRVLNKTQITSLRKKLDNWSKDVRQMEKLLEDRIQEIVG